MFLEPCLLANLLTADILSRSQQKVKAFMFLYFRLAFYRHLKTAQIDTHSLNLADELGTTDSPA